MRVGAFVAACAVALTGTTEADAGTSHSLIIVPGPVLLNESADFNECIKANIFGGLEIDFAGGSISGCPWSPNTATGWSSWAGGDINVPWAPNPSSGNDASWNASVPANTEFRARVALMDQSGGIGSVGPWVYGGGVKSGHASNSGFGGMIINFQMRSWRATTSSPKPTPVLHTVAGLVYSS